MHTRTIYASRHDLIVADETQDDPQEVAGDPFAEYEWSDCPNDPHGHLMRGWFGKRRCVKCGVWG